MKKLDLILFAGQSNMAGRGEAKKAPEVLPGAGYEFRAISDPVRLYPVSEPFGQYENVPGKIDDGRKKSGSMIPEMTKVNTFWILCRSVWGILGGKIDL